MLKQQKSDHSEIDRLRAIIASLQYKLFGNRKGEQIDSRQLELQLSGAKEALVLLEAKQQADQLRKEEKQAESKEKAPRARFIYPEDIEEVTETHIPDEVQAAPECYKQIGQDVTELLDIVPMKFIKKRIVRPRYVHIEKRHLAPISAPLPQRVLSGGLPGLRLLVHILLAKFVDHLPLYRQSQIFLQRYGVKLDRQRMAEWMRIVAEDWLSLIYYSIKSDLLGQDYLHVDDAARQRVDGIAFRRKVMSAGGPLGSVKNKRLLTAMTRM